MTFPNQNPKHLKTQSELEPSQNPQRPTSTSNRKLSSLNKKRKPLSLIIAYSDGLGSNGTTMLSYAGVIERLKVNDIVFFSSSVFFSFLSVFEIELHEEL